MGNLHPNCRVDNVAPVREGRKRAAARAVSSTSCPLLVRSPICLRKEIKGHAAASFAAFKRSRLDPTTTAWVFRGHNSARRSVRAPPRSHRSLPGVTTYTEEQNGLVSGALSHRSIDRSIDHSRRIGSARLGSARSGVGDGLSLRAEWRNEVEVASVGEPA